MAACPYCGVGMTRPARGRQFKAAIHLPTDRSWDHIRPRAWGGNDSAENRRWCCRRCNELRARCGHCPAALIMAIGVANDLGVKYSMIVERWRLSTINANPLVPSHGSARAKPGHLAKPSAVGAAGVIMAYVPLNPAPTVEAMVDRATKSLYGKKAARRIRDGELTAEQASTQLERRMEKAENRRLLKKAREMAKARAAAIASQNTGS